MRHVAAILILFTLSFLPEQVWAAVEGTRLEQAKHAYEAASANGDKKAAVEAARAYHDVAQDIYEESPTEYLPYLILLADVEADNYIPSAYLNYLYAKRIILRAYGPESRKLIKVERAMLQITVDLQDFLGAYDHAENMIALYQKYDLEQTRDAAVVYGYLAKAYQQNEENEAAASSVQKAIKIVQAFSKPSDFYDLAEQYFLLGEIWADIGQYEKAVDAFKKPIEALKVIHPRHSLLRKAHIRLITAYHQLEKPEKILAHCYAARIAAGGDSMIVIDPHNYPPGTIFDGDVIVHFTFYAGDDCRPHSIKILAATGISHEQALKRLQGYYALPWAAAGRLVQTRMLKTKVRLSVPFYNGEG
jgi:tetratricopeptide (TPR) repeat protein